MRIFLIQVSCQARRCRYLLRAQIIHFIRALNTGTVVTTGLLSPGTDVTVVLNPTTSPGTAGILSQTFTTIRTRIFLHSPIVRIRVSITDHKTKVMITEHKTMVSTPGKMDQPIFDIGHPTISSKGSTHSRMSMGQPNCITHILMLITIPQILILF